jgi:hypothetical protein
MPPRLSPRFWRDLKKELLNPFNYLWEFATGYAFYLGAQRLGYGDKEKGFTELHRLADTRRNAAGKGEASNEAQAGVQDTRSRSQIHAQAINPTTGRIANGVEYLLTFRPFDSPWQHQSMSQSSDQ